MGLTIPYRRFSGRLQQKDELNEERQTSAENLWSFYNYLKKLSNQKELLANLELDEFKSDLDKKLYFQSNIPQGYGVGSSGAICAAVFDAYSTNKFDMDEELCLPELKQIFAQMESYFHGVSSGLDPLNSYLKRALLIHNKEQLKVVDNPGRSLKDKLTVFLIDTKVSGETEQLVNIFFDKCRHYKYYKEIKNKLIPLNNACIELFMHGEADAFINTVKKLSLFFYEHFKPMIPASFIDPWEKGISKNIYSLKLCGSGGGGFMLGFTTDYEATINEFPNDNIQKLEL